MVFFARDFDLFIEYRLDHLDALVNMGSFGNSFPLAVFVMR
ncbi:hypothetical protein Mal52_61170 [Symmachiella dynata]|uniref:Uncharacterized protein n=1 Tax=Symmachiella dynata TaxID=2527995 RepID=A0A517ZYL1_9PLAN|nr:hypothetical protein Mal52_61170 [Symmachiella dynata]